jgi:hypothetical protein
LRVITTVVTRLPATDPVDGGIKTFTTFRRRPGASASSIRRPDGGHKCRARHVDERVPAPFKVGERLQFIPSHQEITQQ